MILASMRMKKTSLLRAGMTKNKRKKIPLWMIW
jgi:hypothetical protein